MTRALLNIIENSIGRNLLLINYRPTYILYAHYYHNSHNLTNIRQFYGITEQDSQIIGWCELKGSPKSIVCDLVLDTHIDLTSLTLSLTLFASCSPIVVHNHLGTHIVLTGNLHRQNDSVNPLFVLAIECLLLFLLDFPHFIFLYSVMLAPNDS